MIDVIIIGNGPAGISAALYTKRANIKTVVIGKDYGALEKAEKIENYYGLANPIAGKDLIESGLKQLENLNIEYIKEEVIGINNEDNAFKIVTNKNEYFSKAVILATGLARVNSNLEGIKKYEGKGVSYCAVCDGFFFKNKDVAVLGNGDYAIHEIQQLLPLVNSVSVLTNGKEKILLRDERIKVYDKTIKRISGSDRIEKIEFEDNTAVKVSALFVAEGAASSIDFAKRIGAITNDKNIVVDNNYMTNIPGLFAAGDCIGGLLQISKAVSDGAQAGISVINYIRNKK